MEMAMSLYELETAVSQLPADDLTAFAQWFEEYLADHWDRRIEADIQAGKLDKLAEEAVAEFRRGETQPFPE